ELRHIFFFFQAEDGIRDFHVTGVQTCALPISYSLGRPGMLNLLLGAVVISQILFLPVYTRLSRRLSKGGAWTAGALVTGAGTARSEERRVGKGGRCGGSR